MNFCMAEFVFFTIYLNIINLASFESSKVVTRSAMYSSKSSVKFTLRAVPKYHEQQRVLQRQGFAILLQSTGVVLLSSPPVPATSFFLPLQRQQLNTTRLACKSTHASNSKTCLILFMRPNNQRPLQNVCGKILIPAQHGNRKSVTVSCGQCCVQHDQVMAKDVGP